MVEPNQPVQRVAFYCRVSTEEQRDGQTIESQIRELERFAALKGWLTTGIYKDDGWSGAILARPSLDRLRDDASRHRFDIVLLNDVDRLARDVTHLGVIKRDLERWSVRVVFRKLPGEQSPTQNLLVNILGSFAEFEKEMISDRTRRGRRHKVEVRQQFLGSIPPYGFKYTVRSQSQSGQGLLEIRRDEAATVKAMYRWVSEEELSAAKVKQRLNEMKVPPRKGNDKWAKSSVLRILRSQVYAGVWHYNKHVGSEPRSSNRQAKYRRHLRTSNRLRPKTDWLPVQLSKHLQIVDLSVWRRVQEQLNRNIVFSKRNSKHTYLLAGLVRCGGCNAAYVGEPGHGRFAYRCSKRCKRYPSISENRLNGTVWNAVSTALQRPAIVLQGIKDIRSHRLTVEQQDCEDAANGVQNIETEEARIIEAYRLQVLTVDEFSRQMSMLKARRKVLGEQKSRTACDKTDPRQTARRSLTEYCNLLSSKLRALDLNRKQQVLRLLLSKIVFEGSRVRISGAIPLGTDAEESHIATTPPYSRGLNNALQTNEINPGRTETNRDFLNILHRAQDADRSATFELMWDVLPENTEAKIAASRANLLKANAARHTRGGNGSP